LTDLAPLWKDTSFWVVGRSELARGRVSRLLKYAIVLALAVAIGAFFVLGPLSLEDIVPSHPEQRAAVAPVEATPLASPASIDEELDYIVAYRLASLAGWRAFLAAHANGAYAQSARAEIEKRLGAGKPPAPGNAEVLNGAASDVRESNKATDSVSAASGDAVPTMAAAALPNDASPDAKPADESARPVTPHAETDVAAGAQFAALTQDEICQRDGEHLDQLRSNPSSDELVRFANELGCKKLLPQVVRLMTSLPPPPPAAADVSNSAPSTARAVGADARPASPVGGADVAALTSNETCKRDADRLARLRSNPLGEEAQRFASELSCEALRPQLQRLMESLGLVAPTQPAAANSSPASDSSFAQICASERAALDRLRKEPSAEAAGLFWRDLKCEGLRPQIRLLMESLNVAPDTVGSSREAERREAASSDALSPNEADPAACRRETAELNRIRATLDLGEARRFASAVTCETLKPQAARLLESLRE
jgi:hypothetical protein